MELACYVIVIFVSVTLLWIYFCADYKQEGQHPLTGQRAANFRLLANQ